MTFFNCPLSIEHAERLMASLDLSPSTRVLDAGCGRGEFLIRLMVESGSDGIGIDINADLIDDARQRAGGRLPQPSKTFRQGNIQEVGFSDRSFDAIVCLGSTHAFASGVAAFPKTLESAMRWLRPSGQLLVGEGYWKQPPDPEYLALIGEPTGVYRTHKENNQLGERFGFEPQLATVSQTHEWDAFESAFLEKAKIDAEDHPDDAKLVARYEQIKVWNAGYHHWGRSTMGFGFYRFIKPESTASDSSLV